MSESTTVLVQTETVGAQVIVTGATVIGTVPIGPQGPPGVIDADDVVALFTGTPDGTQFLRDDGTLAEPAGGGGGVTDADFLVGTAHAGLSAEIVVGTTPGGELGGTWASPTVDATHSGSSHASVQAAAEATAAADATAKVAAEATARDAAIETHRADTTNVHGIADTSALVVDGDAAGGVLSGTYPNPGFAADMASQAELDAAVADLISGDGSITEIVALTQAEYDALTPNATTYYIITDAAGSGGVQSVDGLTGDVDLSDSYVSLTTERIWLRPADFAVQGGSPLLTGNAGDTATQGWMFDSSTEEGITATFAVPAGWGSVDVDLWWLNDGAGSGDVLWWIVLRDWADGTDTPTLRADQTRTETALGENVMNRREDFITAATVDPERICKVQILRAGNNGADTLGNDATFLGLTLRRAG